MATNCVNFGVMGAGGIAYRRTIPGMLKAKNCRLVAVMDPVNIERVAAEFKVPKAYTREEELLGDPEVEAVYIASPVNCHLKQVQAAAAAGKHILCEKPLAMNLAQTKEAVAACKKAKVYLQEGYMMKFHGAHAAIKQMIDQGRLGRIVYMRAQLSCWYPQMPGAWRQDPKLGGGGALIDMATHLYDLLAWFAGPVRRVAAMVNTLVQDYKSDDASTTLLEFKSGAQATVDCFYCIPDEASRTRLEVYGSQGAVLTEGTIGQSVGGVLEALQLAGAAGYDAQQSKDVARKFQKVPFPKVNPYTAECSYFADCILQGRPPALNDGRNALTIAELTDKAYRSYKQRKML
ncbi:MAG TPA: Gfo/Idh/MocA family oxidoreductase [Candidatus Anammoximicrobium sp.]|nr:Gfo/Idh/MocA family oxidoreductase [Candidatus Anammoximicrobium sp.]